MNNETFQVNKFFVIGIVGVVCAAFTVAYFLSDLPIWVLPIVLVIGALIVVSSIKTKLVIEDGLLRYEKWGGGDEVPLARVAQIVTREVETIVNRTVSESGTHGGNTGGVTIGKVRLGNRQNLEQERSTEKVVYVLDEAGRTFFSFPASMIGFKHRTRFKEAVKAVNPRIEIF